MILDDLDRKLLKSLRERAYNNRPTPTMRRIGASVGCSERTVQKRLARMRKAGLFEVESHSGRQWSVVIFQTAKGEARTRPPEPKCISDGSTEICFLPPDEREAAIAAIYAEQRAQGKEWRYGP